MKLPQQSGILVATLLLVGLPGISSADVSGYLTVTTDYVRRGVTQTDGDPAVQLGLDVSFDSGVYAGSWVSTTDINNGPGRQRDLETDFYLGYLADAGQRWTLGAGVVAYRYPGAEGSVDYDYTEFSLSANYDDTVWFEYTFSPDLYNTDYETHNYAVYLERPAFPGWVVGAGAGYYDVSRLTGIGYGYWELGLTRSMRRLTFDLRYHDSNRPVPFVSSAERSESRFAFSITLSF